MPADGDRFARAVTPGRTRPPRSVVVVGAGLAGSQAVAALRGQGFDGHLTVLGAEGVEPYDRPPLSKELLTRTEPAWLRDDLGTDLSLADDVRLAEAALGLEIGEAESVDEGRTTVVVRTASGPVRADAVILATGSHALRPRGWEAAMTLHTTADAERLRVALTPGAHLVVVGAGWIGAEVAGVAAAHGLEVTVVEAGPAPLAVALGAPVGALTVPWYAASGVRLLTATSVVSVEDRGADGTEVRLATGEVLRADVVLAAVGARPTSAWLGAAVPCSADGSVVVDERYRVPGTGGRVVAVGDLARRRSPRHGWVAGGHWDGALRSPAIAVAALLDEAGADPGSPVPDPAPYVFSTQLGHELGAYGLPGPTDDVVLRGDPSGPFTVLWFTAGTDELTAVLAVDRPRDVGAARKLFAGVRLPQVDRIVVSDPGRPLC